MDFVTTAHDLLILKYTLAATLMLLLYEHVITLGDEERLVWSSQISLVKVAFFLNRYLPYAASFVEVYLYILNDNNSLCKPLLYTANVSVVLVFKMGELILFLRVYAIWHCQKRFFVLLSSAFFIGWVISIVSTIWTTKPAIAVVEPMLFPRGCLITFPDRQFWVSYIVLIFNESLTIILILVRALYAEHYSVSALLELIMKDGILYYICVLAMSIANMLFLTLAPASICSLFIVTQGALHSILCSRLLLRLRGAYESLTDEGLRTTRMQALSTLVVCISSHDSMEEESLYEDD